MSIPTSQEFDRYETTYERIEAAIVELTPEQMRHTPGEGEWSIQQIIVHLADAESVGYERLRRTIAENHPTLQPYDEQAWAYHLNYQQQDYRPALALFRLQRQATAILLRQLPVESWERTALHAESGEMSLYDIFQVYLLHGEAHLQQIQEVKQAIAGVNFWL